MPKDQSIGFQGLPHKNAPPTMPRRGGPVEKRSIPNVKKVIAVASGKGGVGKSTVAGTLIPNLRTMSLTSRSESCVQPLSSTKSQ